MGALSERSSNRQSPMGNFKTNRGYRQLSYHRISDENGLSNKMRSRITDQAPPATSVTNAETLQLTTPKSMLPVRASTPTSPSCDASKDRASVASAVKKAAFGQSHIATLQRKKGHSGKSQPLLQTPFQGGQYFTPFSKHLITTVAKPLPSPPIAQVVTNTPEHQGRSLIDASEKPLRRSPGTPEEDEWPTLTPAVRSSAPSAARNVMTGTQPQDEARSVHSGKTMAVRDDIPTPVASQLDRSPSGMTIGKAITSSEPMTQHHRQRGFQIVGDNSAASPAAAEEPDPTTGNLCCTEPSKPESVTPQRFVMSFSRPRTVDCVAESETTICRSKSPMEPRGSPFAAPSTAQCSEEMQSLGKVIEDASLALKVELGTPNVYSLQSRSRLPRLSQAEGSGSTPRKVPSRLGSKPGAPLKNDPLLVLQLEKGHSTEGGPETHGTTTTVLPYDSDHKNSRRERRNSVAPSDEAVRSTSAPGDPLFESGQRIKRLSYSPHAPDLGPTLTISNEAEAIIMGVQMETGTIATNIISEKVRRLSQDLQRSALLNRLWKTPKQEELLQTLRQDDTSRPASSASFRGPQLIGDNASLSLGKEKNHVHGSPVDVQDLEHDDAAAWVHVETADTNLQDDKTLSVKQGQGIPQPSEDPAMEHATLNGAETGEDKRSVSPHPNLILRRQGDLSRESIGGTDPLGTDLGHGPQYAVQDPIVYQSVPHGIPTPPSRASSLRLSPDAVGTRSGASASQPRSAQASGASTMMDGPAVPSKESLLTDHISRLPRYSSSAAGRSLSRTSRRDSSDVTSKFNSESPRNGSQRHTVTPLSHDLIEASDTLRPTEPVVGLTTGTMTLGALESRNPRARDSVTEDSSKAPRSKSRTRIAMSMLGGLFHMRSRSSGKAAAKGEHDQKQSGTTNNPLPPFKFPPGVSEPKYQTMHMPRTKLGPESPRLQQIRRPSTAYQARNPSSAPTRHSKDVSEATAMAMAIMEQARSEKESPKKDKLVSLAAVMVDAITNARDAQRFMHTAQQAAKDARLSYDLTQRSIAEIGRLVKESGPAMDLSTFRRLQSD